jgi:hypothetical protein
MNRRISLPNRHILAEQQATVTRAVTPVQLDRHFSNREGNAKKQSP